MTYQKDSKKEFSNCIVVSTNSAFMVTPQNKNQNCLLVTRQNDNHSPGPGSGGLVLAVTREVNLATPSSAPSAEEMRFP